MDDVETTAETLDRSQVNDLIHDLVARFNELEARVRELEEKQQAPDRVELPS